MCAYFKTAAVRSDMTFKKKLIGNDKGMTLIDISIALLVIGLLIAPIIEAFNRSKIQDPIDIVDSNFDVVEKAIDDFYFENDRYPCPADPTLGPNDDEIGYERCDGADWSGNNTDGVLEGAVPFETLKIPREASLDGWQRKIFYAVSMPQSDINSPSPLDFDMSRALLNVEELEPVRENTTGVEVCPHPGVTGITPGQLVPKANTGSHYILLTHGENAMGAYTADGTLIEACDMGANAPLESENCDGDAVFRLQTCTKNDPNTVDQFDDIATSQNQLPSRIWENPDVGVGRTSTRIGLVGINNEDPEFEVDIIGNLKTEGDGNPASDAKGNAMTDKLCTNDALGGQPTTCFPPSLITGQDPDMDCTTSNAMTGISRNKALCDVKYFSGASMDCGNKKYMAGICPDGQPLCVDPDNPGTPSC